MEEIELYSGHNSAMVFSIVTIVRTKKAVSVVSNRTRFIHLVMHLFVEHCVNNLYSCAPRDDLRCDLACQMLGYVPCQTIQDRRACQQHPVAGECRSEQDKGERKATAVQYRTNGHRIAVKDSTTS